MFQELDVDTTRKSQLAVGICSYRQLLCPRELDTISYVRLSATLQGVSVSSRKDDSFWTAPERSKSCGVAIT